MSPDDAHPDTPPRDPAPPLPEPTASPPDAAPDLSAATPNHSHANHRADRPVTELTCPHCRAKYRTHRATAGRRLRCRHCNHVWRHEPTASGQVSAGLNAAAQDWMRIGSTLLAEHDHASTIAHLVDKADKHGRPPASVWIDKPLGRYDIRAVLGEGAMGYVYEARDRDLHREVALKILPKRIEPGLEPLGLKLFLQEARVAARLQHPNATTVYEVGHEGGTYFFAMERVHGVTLASLIEQNGPLPAQQVCYIAAHAARALAAGHAMGIAHRDVKPSNIMIDHHGYVKVTDFGLADVEGIERIKEAAGRPVGTPGWLSPEAARGEAAGPAGDIYALGLVIYTALTGQRLTKAETRSGLVRAVAAAKSVVPDQLPDHWPPRLRDIVAQCLQAEPAARYQSAQTLAADLLRSLSPPGKNDETVMLKSEPRLSALDLKRLRDKGWVALIVLAILTAVALRLLRPQ